MEHFFKKYFKVKDIWFRIEFEHRRSPHKHGPFWFEDALDLNKISSNDDKNTRKIVKYFEEFISTWKPDPSQVYDIHPPKFHFMDVPEEAADYNLLKRAVQVHKGSKAYCKRKKKDSSEVTCRFNFPKECSHESKIHRLNNEPEYI